MTKNNHLISVAFVGLLCFVMITGCEHGTQADGFAYGDSSVPVEEEKEKDKDKEEPVPVNNFVGTWKLASATGASWYAFFYPDGNWKICDNADGSSQRVFGSYSVSGGTLNGNMTNPGVGTGSITATIYNGVMTLDFVENWNSPPSTVRYTGTRL